MLGLFERSHMEYEYDRPTDAGTEPSLTQMTLKAIDLLKNGAGRRAGEAVRSVDLRDTLILASADHSHVFNIAGYPLRPLNELPYPVPSYDSSDQSLAGNGILDLVHDVNLTTRHVEPSTDANGVPYTALVYGNGPGYRGAARTDPRTDPFPGRGGVPVDGPAHQAYFQESAVPIGSETHSGEEVAILGADTLLPMTISVATTIDDRAATTLVVTRMRDRVRLVMEGHRREWLFARNPVNRDRVSGYLIDQETKQVLEHDDTDLLAREGLRGWADVILMRFDPRALPSLRATGDVEQRWGTVFRRFVSTEVGKAGVIEVWWSEALLLPSR